MAKYAKDFPHPDRVDQRHTGSRTGAALERLTEPLDEAPADETGGEMMESLEDVGEHQDLWGARDGRGDQR
jgi:hypothetical protein